MKPHPLQAIIVDDEKHAIDSLKILLEEFNEVDVVQPFSSSQSAYDYTIKYKPDLIFLDIKMPEVSGIDFARRLIDLNFRIPIIFTTAYDEFVTEALWVNAVDYLLKPIEKRTA